jgi:hypothetical protein
MAATNAPTRLINPMAEDAYWREAFRQEPYYQPDLNFEDYGPAYRVGYTAPLRREGSFNTLERALAQDFDRVRGRSRLSWEQARKATRAAWERVVGEGRAR